MTMATTSPPSSNPILGTWKLLTAEFVSSEGQVLSSPIGLTPLGRAMFNSDGYMSAIITDPSKVQAFPTNTPWPQAADKDIAFVARSMGGYSGSYKISTNNGELTLSTDVEVSLDPGWIGTAQVRKVSWVEQEGKKLLVLKPLNYVEIPTGEKAFVVLTWEKL